MSLERLNVLYITARAPYPPHRGDTMSAYHQIRMLHHRCAIHLLTIVRDADEERLLDEHVRPWCASVTKVAHAQYDAYAKAATAPFRGVPMQTGLCSINAVRAAVEAALQSIRPDVVHVQTIRMAEFVWRHDGARVMDMIDAISLNMARRADRERFWLKPLINLEAALSARYEKRILAAYDGVTVVSEHDAAYLDNDSVVVNPLGTYVDDELLARYTHVGREQAMMFHGNMYYFPNVDGITWFNREVWPEVHRRHPSYRFYIAGNKPAPAIQAMHGTSNVVVTGFVEDMVAYLRKCTIGVYPLNSGTGMQTKILEALAAGLPLVASPRALQGIPGVEDGVHVLVAESPAEFVAHIDRLLDDAPLRERLSAAGQALVRARYSWESNADTLLRVWERAVEKHHERASKQPS